MKPSYAFEHSRYGFFVHYVACITHDKQNSIPATIDEAVDGFDVDGFARDIKTMKIEYLIFTAWHFRMLPLYPSVVTERWRPGCSAKRDLLREVIDAVRAIGVKVILYTHPRDGHDFIGDERVRCGWGEGHGLNDPATPNPDTFDFATWNRYVLELYQELLDRYADKIDGIYTDGMGPGHYDMKEHRSHSYTSPIIDYLALRRMIKHANPDIAIIQNGFGSLFSNDFMMPELYFGFELSRPDTAEWPASQNALAMAMSRAGWSASGRYGEDMRLYTPADIARFAVFQATCAKAGGTCWAAGPYCGGGWDIGIMETMTEVGNHIERIGEALNGVVQSASWPTISGDTMKSRGYICACTSSEGHYEYIHILKKQDLNVILLPPPEDGALFDHPAMLTPGMAISEFTQSENGVKIQLSGTMDEIDTVIRLRRENRFQPKEYLWINDSDKRIRYSSGWVYSMLRADYETHDEHAEQLGCFDSDSRTANEEGMRFDTFFEGREIELYGVLDKNGGQADVLIDDIKVATVKTDAPERRTREKLYASGDLLGGVHTFSLVVKSGPFEFDALRIRL